MIVTPWVVLLMVSIFSVYFKHDTFHSSGISSVLVVAQNWVQKLVQGKHFKLMVCILMGGCILLSIAYSGSVINWYQSLS